MVQFSAKRFATATLAVLVLGGGAMMTGPARAQAVIGYGIDEEDGFDGPPPGRRVVIEEDRYAPPPVERRIVERRVVAEPVVEHRVIEHRVVRPVERQVVVRRVVEQPVARAVVEERVARPVVEEQRIVRVAPPVEACRTVERWRADSFGNRAFERVRACG